MNLTRKNLPQLPAQLSAPSMQGTLGFTLYAFGLFLLPALAAACVFDTPVSAAIRYPTIALCEFIAGWGLFALASAAHEGFHYTLHSNKKLSATLGVFISSAVPGFFGAGFFVYHWNHHRFTNTAKDPDCAHFSQYSNLLSRLLLVRLGTNMRYAQYVLEMAFRRTAVFQYASPLSAQQLTYFSRLNLLTQGFWLTAYALLLYVDPQLFVFIVALPLVFVLLITGISPYLEHADTGLEIGANSRSRTSMVFSALQIGTNFHAEHHMYPSVPCWRLHKVYSHLRAMGFYETYAIPHEIRFLSSFRYALGKYQYPAANPPAGKISEGHPS